MNEQQAVWCREHGLPVSDIALADQIQAVAAEVSHMTHRIENDRARLKSEQVHLDRLLRERQRRAEAV